MCLLLSDNGDNGRCTPCRLVIRVSRDRPLAVSHFAEQSIALLGQLRLCVWCSSSVRREECSCQRRTSDTAGSTCIRSTAFNFAVDSRKSKHEQNDGIVLEFGESGYGVISPFLLCRWCWPPRKGCWGSTAGSRYTRSSPKPSQMSYHQSKQRGHDYEQQGFEQAEYGVSIYRKTYK